ncbi:extracellular solute-binding protein [Saccharibacillus sp. CPCC 101409]|uniref:extracellular solute-binding protein n=1 Tax=Saccharibacillus sp. CPCC 101409 TaxID=3058041 RepID=UPI002671BEB3|nr:extracellular solute-binding protein [Saccharibacillus sp. CPCC 101409]MDO3409312.1 extracellular solute-binding protein [Saccharibacillus sp. CPCC 101409]
MKSFFGQKKFGSGVTRAASLSMAAVLLAGLTACGGGDAKESAPAEQSSGFHKEGLPIVDEPVTLKVLTMRWGNMGDTFTQNQWLKDLEKDTNVKIEWQVVSSNDWSEQKSILLASGKLPDIILGDQTFSDSDIVNNLSFFRPLDDYIDEYMPNLKAAMEETPELRKISTFPDGKIYSLPTRLPSRPKTKNQPVINKAWLDKLGLKAPETVEDLHTVLKAFKEKDPNGNGKADEIPYTETGLGMDFLNPFGITDINGNNMLVKGGKPVYYPITDEYKEALKWAHEMYKEGLIDPEIFTQDATMTSAKQQNPDAAIVGFTNQWTPDAVFGKWKDQYETIAPIAGPSGERYNPGDPNGMSFNRNELLITSSCANPEAAARWADQFYTNEASIQNFWGAIGTVIEQGDDGTFTLMDPPEGTSADAWYWEQSLRDFGPKYVSPSFEDQIVLNPETGDGLKLEIDKLGRDYVTTPYPNVMYSSEEFQELPTLTTDIDGYVSTMRAQWVSKGGIDEGWDAYLKQLDQMGLEQLMKIRTEAYGRYMSAE